MPKTPQNVSPHFEEKLRATLAADGVAATEVLIREHEASLWWTLAQASVDQDAKMAMTCAQRAFDVAPRRFKRPYARHLVALATRFGNRDIPTEAINLLRTSPNQAEAARFTRIVERSKAWERLAERGYPTPSRVKESPYQPISGKVLFVVDRGQPEPLSDYPELAARLIRYGMAVAVTEISPVPVDDPQPEQALQQIAADVEAAALRERPAALYVVTSSLSSSPVVATSRKLGIPVVLHVHDLISERPVDDFDWYLSRAYDAAITLETTAATLSDAVVCTTPGLQQIQIARGIDPSKITVIERSVAIPPAALGQTRSDLINFGIVAQGIDEQEHLLHAIAILIDQGHPIRIHWIDDKGIGRQTAALIDDLELTNDVVVESSTTSTDAGFEIAILAAEQARDDERRLISLMARGSAVVILGNANPSGPIVDGESGVACQSTALDDLISCLRTVVSDQDLRGRLGGQARAWVEANRSTDIAARTLRDLYRELPYGDRVPKLVRPESHDERLWWKLMKPLERKRQAGILDYVWNGDVLDLGTRNGIIAAQIALTQEPTSIVGIDPDIAALHDAHQIVATNQITTSRIEFVAAIGEQLPFADQVFDGVIITQVLEHVEHPELVLQETVRVLKPNGSVLVGVPGYGIMPPGTTIGHVQDFTIAEMTNLINASGLDLIEQRTLDVREYYFARLPASS